MFHITLATKCRWKGMVIILCLCVCVRKILGKLQTLVAPTCSTTGIRQIVQLRIKNNKRLLLKPFGYKVISTALCILLYSGVSTYVGLYGSGLFNFGSYVDLPTYFLGFDVPTSSFIFIENVFIILV